MVPAGPLPIALLVALGVLLLFVALWRRYGSKDLIASRLGEYGQVTDPISSARQTPAGLRDRLGRSIRRMTWAEGLANALRQADVPYTAVEYALIMLALAAGAFLLGTARAGLIAGIPLGALGLYAPILYLKSKGNKRRATIADQLPDVLTLLVGALRAGYGLSQALNVVGEQAPQPSRDEYARALRAVELGVPLQQAMTDMAKRLNSDDIDLFVTTINIQFELGGNLAQTLDTIGETIRDRIRLQREIRTQTSQQQMTGYVLVGLPILLAVGLTLITPDFMKPLFEPGWPRLMLVGMAVMEFVGAMIMRKILDLDV